MAQQKIFGNGVIASVLLLGKHQTTLEIDEKGILTIPERAKANAFALLLLVPKKVKVVFAHRNIKKDQGEYAGTFLSQIKIEDYYIVTTNPIQVVRFGENVWTNWHQQNPNRVDCWILKGTLLELFQIGIITHDNGQTFRLLGEYRWQGEIFYDKKLGIVGRPNNPKWGSFKVRRQILDYPEFKKLLNGTLLRPWQGKPEKLDPPLDDIRPGFGRVSWYNPFAGQTGQGIVTLHNGSSVWIHGANILNYQSDFDGIVRLWRNQVVQYGEIQRNWGTKEGPPKLLNVKVLKRTKPAPV